MAAARGYARRFGGALGLGAEDGLLLAQETSLRGAGRTVRFRQSVQGLPVVGGELVVGLDRANNLKSLSGEATRALAEVAPAQVSAKAAARVAEASSRGHHGRAGTLLAGEPRLWFYDPQVFDVEDPTGAGPVWRIEVSDGFAVRDLVLVDAVTGRVRLRVEEVNAADRVVCDRQNAPFAGVEVDCRSVAYARTEAGPESAVLDVEAAFAHAGATADLYADVTGRDLGDFAGVDIGDGPKLRSTVRVCVPGEQCPWPNAFWNGRGMYYGQGYAGADDIVGHELTHAVIDKTAGLFYHYQSGAISESVADVFGELVDLRYGDDAGDRAWTIGEDVPGGAMRDMADPGAFDEPDRMTSPLYVADPFGMDAGGVHTNSGVGNKAAHLIAEGGDFNGQTITGLDAGQATKPKTAAIYWAALQLLTSASDYQDLYWVLPQACRQLASANAVGIVAGDCEQVVKAVTATEMHLQPVTADTAAHEAARCPASSVETPVFVDDFEQDSGAWSRAGVWQSTPNADMPSYATSGTRSYFGWDPDPYLYGDPADSPLTLKTIDVPASGRAFLWFAHAYLFEWYDDGAAGRRYVDGGRVEYSTDNGMTWANTADLPWVNGPDKPLTPGATGSYPGFGGDSHGYTSSRLDLSSLAGQSVRLRWRITGDHYNSSGLGWWLDDVSVHTCRSRTPSAPTQLQAQSGSGTVALHWLAPGWPGTGISGYRITTDSAQQPVAVAADTVRTKLSGLKPGVTYRVQVRALNVAGQSGAAATTVVAGTKTTISGPSKVRYGTRAIISGTLKRVDVDEGLWGNIVRLYRRPAMGGAWALVEAKGASYNGGYAFRVTPTVHSRYRTVFAGIGSTLGSRSAEVVTQVQPRLSARLSRGSVKRGAAASISGRAEPAMTGDRLFLQRRAGTGYGKWATIKSLRLAGLNYKFGLPTGKRGIFIYRVSKPAGSQRLAGYSTGNRLRVY